MDKVLIIDDHLNIRRMLERRLGKLGYQTFSAEDAPHAEALMQGQEVDIVLLDYMMPEISGFDFFLDYLKQQGVPVIMMTAHASLNLAIEFIRIGGADFVEKPVDVDVLDIKIKRALKQHRAYKKAIEDRENAERQLRESHRNLEALNQELDAFTSTISHDLRAPLRHIITFTQILEEKIQDDLDEEAEKYFKIISDSAIRMNDLIIELLNLARMGKKPLEMQRIDTAKMVGDIIRPFRAADTANQLVFEVGELPAAYGDATLLGQAFANLIQNAVKYSSKEEASRVRVSGEEKEGELVFSVVDNGVGFNMKYAAKLFQPFKRLHSKREFEGTGVGLATVKRIAERHGGRVWAEAEEGKGATFYFALPKGEAAELHKGKETA